MPVRRPSPGETRPGRLEIWVSRSIPYLTAVVATAAAAVVRWLLDPAFRNHSIFLFFILAAFFTAWRFGWRPGIVAMLLGTIATAYLFAPPRWSLWITMPEHQIGMLFYLVVTGAGVAMCEARLRAERRSETHAQELKVEIEAHRETQERLRATNATLEAKVAERTSELTEANARLREEISVRNQIENELRRLAAIVTSSNDAIIGRNLEGLFDHWNAAAERLFGYPAEEVLGTPATLLVPENRRHEFREKWEQIRRTGFVEPFETVRCRRDGTEFPVQISMSPVRMDGEVVGASAIIRDLSYTKQLEEQLRQAIKMEAVGQLAGGIAHDFNNLLTVINGYCDMLLADLPASDPNLGAIEQIGKAGERAASLTSQLLAFSRRTILEPKVLNLNAVICDLDAMLRRLIGEDIVFETRLHREIGKVRVDPGQLSEVVVNLAVNAREAMPKGGKLTIETANIELNSDNARLHPGSVPGRYVMLTVADTGSGMTKDVLARVFEPFFTTKAVGKGTGLGLSVVHGIVQQSGGIIEVQSEVGVGTAFKIYFPVVEQPLFVEPAPEEIDYRGTETILLVEDEDGVRGLASRCLRERGYSVIVAQNGRDALSVLSNNDGKIDLLLTDVVMPEMGGRELAELLRARIPGLRVLYMSGYTVDAVIRHGVLEDEVAVLQKPFTPNELAKKVRATLDETP